MEQLLSRVYLLDIDGKKVAVKQLKCYPTQYVLCFG